MPKPDFSNDTNRLAARTRTLRALNAETADDAQASQSTNEGTTVDIQPAKPRDRRPRAPKDADKESSTTSRSPTTAKWSNRMASLNTEVPFDMRELIDELYVKRRKVDKREGRKLTTYADLTTEAFELLLRKTQIGD
jgi:hypothetical protein